MSITGRVSDRFLYLQGQHLVLKSWVVSSVLFLSLCLRMYGQQTFQNSLFYLDPYDMNPAYIGIDDRISMVARYRQQWMGLEGSPGFARFNIHVPLRDYHAGFGLKLASESIGVMEDTVSNGWDWKEVPGLPDSIYMFRSGIIMQVLV
ncbi:MAG TPA: type IX secretion system membrane protein PorP/SprF [Saprospiraceae bacterium]|nr:type IX secretion system membrane protein PorP/SprF [Saprospiraceae bacterium]